MEYSLKLLALIALTLGAGSQATVFSVINNTHDEIEAVITDLDGKYLDGTSIAPGEVGQLRPREYDPIRLEVKTKKSSRYLNAYIEDLEHERFVAVQSTGKVDFLTSVIDAAKKT